jgi:phage terminase small subunit
MNRFAEQFGLTPASRSRIVADTTSSGSEDELEALLGGDA